MIYLFRSSVDAVDHSQRDSSSPMRPFVAGSRSRSPPPSQPSSKLAARLMRSKSAIDSAETEQKTNSKRTVNRPSADLLFKRNMLFDSKKYSSNDLNNGNDTEQVVSLSSPNHNLDADSAAFVPSSPVDTIQTSYRNADRITLPPSSPTVINIKQIASPDRQKIEDLEMYSPESNSSGGNEERAQQYTQESEQLATAANAMSSASVHYGIGDDSYHLTPNPIENVVKSNVVPLIPSVKYISRLDLVSIFKTTGIRATKVRFPLI